MNGHHGEIAVNAGSAGERTLTSVTENRQVDLIGISLDANTLVRAVFGSSTVSVTASIDQPSYALHVNNVGITGTVEYTLTMPDLKAGSTQHLTPDSTQQLVVVEIDTESDGFIDNEVTVMPTNPPLTDKRLYLPIVVK
jgi:hypothetical protein